MLDYGIQHWGLTLKGEESHMEVSESEANDRDAERCGHPGGRKGTNTVAPMRSDAIPVLSVAGTQVPPRI